MSRGMPCYGAGQPDGCTHQVGIDFGDEGVITAQGRVISSLKREIDSRVRRSRHIRVVPHVDCDAAQSNGRVLLTAATKIGRVKQRWYSDLCRIDLNDESVRAAGVVLRAVLGSNGKVTNIVVVSGVPGLTDGAINAARKIKFDPAIKDGRYVSMWVQLEYNFR